MGMEAEDARELICRVVKDMDPIQVCEVTAGARKAVEDKLRNLPDLCEALEAAEGLEAVLLTHEVKKIKRVLESISDDPYYMAVAGKYFEQMTDNEIAEKISCGTKAAWANRRRLVQRVAVRLYGVEAVK